MTYLLAGQSGGRRARLIARSGLMAVVAAASLAAGCAQPHGASGCAPRPEMLAASPKSGLIVLIPRTSRSEAVWSLLELARLLPFVARAGLELHVLYSQDGDDLGESGGDGGRPQVLLSAAPSFGTARPAGRPASPPDPTPLTTHLYCDHLAAWEARASRKLKNDASGRSTAVRAWMRTVAARLGKLAAGPIADTAGSEAGGRVDAGGSIFAATQVAASASRPVIVLMGGLSALRPPAAEPPVPVCLVALIRSDAPGPVRRAESAWTRWAGRGGGTFEPMSAYDTPEAIARACAPPWK